MPEVISTEEKDTGLKEQTLSIDTENESGDDEIKESVSWQKVVS